MNHPLRRSNTRLTGAAITAAVVLAAACGGGSSDNTSMDQATETAQARNQTSLAAQGRHIFRFETFGDTHYFYARDARDAMARLEGQAAVTFMHRPANLEDVFLKLTGRELRD